MECPKCGGKTMVDVTRPVNYEDGPQEVKRQRRCVDTVCRFRFVTEERWEGAAMKYPNWRTAARKRARGRATAAREQGGAGASPKF